MNDSKVSIVGNKAYIVEEIPFEYEFSENIEKIFVPEDSYNSYSESSLYVSVKEKLYPYNYGAITVNRPEFVKYAKGDYLLEKIYKNGGCLSPDYMTIAEYENNFITFEDTTVKSVIVSKFGSNNEITFKQAAQVTNEQLEGLFNGNTKVTKFNEFVFFTGITKVSISDNTDLSKTNSPFRSCSLQEITLPESVIDLGYRAFDQCKKVTKINFNNIVRFGFCCCQFLGIDVKLVIKLPSYIEVYGSNTNVFYNVYGFELIEGSHLHIKCLNGIARSLLLCGDKIGYYTNGKPFSITVEAETVDGYTFYQCTNITDIEFVGIKRFANKFNCLGLTSLTKIIIPDTCENLGQAQTFAANNSTVREIKLTTNPLCTAIPDRFAANLYGYVELHIPDNFTTIAYAAFGGGDSNRTKKLKRIYMGTGITNIDNLAFYYSHNLEEVTIKAVTPPSLHQDAFKDCNNTFKIYVPKESVEAYKTASVWSNYADNIFPMNN